MSTSNSSEPTIESWIETSFSEAGQAAVDLLPEEAPFYRRYGNYTLRRNDWDGSWPSAPVEEGREIGLANGDVVLPGIVVDPAEEQPPTVSLGGYVTQLQLDLWNLGFGLIREFDGVFGPRTEQAVREFQIYAGMGRVAQENPEAEGEYVERLSGTQNPEGSLTYYDGPISGVANEQTRRCLVHWLLEGYRCPVVITARTGDGYESVYDGGAIAEGADAENLWRHDDVETTACRMFAHDFTGYFLAPSEPGSDRALLNDESTDLTSEIAGSDEGEYEYGDRITLGYYLMDESNEWYGPCTVSQEGQTWDSTEITPELFGTEENSMYNVIEAISQVECNGHLDSLNAYDEALLSAGPYHWTMPRYDKRPVQEGELCGFLSYLKSEYEHTYEYIFGQFGVDVDTDWGENGEALFTSQQKYVASIEKETSGGMELLPMRTGEDPFSEEEASREWDYFRNWHWYYRFLMASRLQHFPQMENSFQEACWDYARMRVEDVLSVQWENPLEHWPDDTTIGDVFTSEKAVAMLVRWHVFHPSSFIDTSGPCQDANLTTVLENARAEVPNLDVDQNAIGNSWTCDPIYWTDDHESALISQIDNVGGDVSGRLGDTLARIDDQPILNRRDSFNW